MSRVKRGSAGRQKHKKVLQLCKGARGSRSTLFRTAKQQSMHSLKYATTHRKTKKRLQKRIWITRINAASRPFGLTYSRFMGGIRKKNILLNRKVLAQLAVLDKSTFAFLTQD
jgi:large subunit ribosomal protein L20